MRGRVPDAEALVPDLEDGFIADLRTAVVRRLEDGEALGAICTDLRRRNQETVLVVAEGRLAALDEDDPDLALVLGPLPADGRRRPTGRVQLADLTSYEHGMIGYLDTLAARADEPRRARPPGRSSGACRRRGPKIRSRAT